MPSTICEKGSTVSYEHRFCCSERYKADSVASPFTTSLLPKCWHSVTAKAILSHNKSSGISRPSPIMFSWVKVNSLSSAAVISSSTVSSRFTRRDGSSSVSQHTDFVGQA